MPFPKMVHEGNLYEVTMRCGHKLLFRTSPPRVHDVIMCLTCGEGRAVTHKEPYLKERAQ